jgi:hypothetical protein
MESVNILFWKVSICLASDEESIALFVLSRIAG